MQSKYTVVIATPLGENGQGGIDRMMDQLRAIYQSRDDFQYKLIFITTRGKNNGMLSRILCGIRAFFAVAYICLLNRNVLLHLNVSQRGSVFRKAMLAAVARLFGSSYIIHLHGSEFDIFFDRTSRWVQRIICCFFRNSSGIIVLGKAWRKHLVDRVPGVERISVVYNAISDPTRDDCIFSGHAHELPGDVSRQIHLLFLGKVCYRKGADVLIDALSRLKDITEPWVCVLAGDGEVEKFSKVANAAGLHNRVDFAGWLDRFEALRQITNSDIVVLPSRAEGLPMSLIEASALSRCIIASPVGAIPELFKHKDNCLLVKPGNTHQLERAIQVLICDRGLRDRLSGNARRTYEEFFGVEQFVTKLTKNWDAAFESANTGKA